MADDMIDRAVQDIFEAILPFARRVGDEVHGDEVVDQIVDPKLTFGSRCGTNSGMRPVTSRLLKFAAVIGCILLGPSLVLAGLTGFYHMACSGEDNGFGWALVTMLVISMGLPAEVVVGWAVAAFALIFLGRLAASIGRPKTFALVSLAAIPACLVIGWISARGTHASMNCALGGF
jgi:hypothetical protein